VTRIGHNRENQQLDKKNKNKNQKQLASQQLLLTRCTLLKAYWRSFGITATTKNGWSKKN
jgi:hypothetical protein